MFEPWRGEIYGDKNNLVDGVRLLVLGESHHCKYAHEIGTTQPETTREVVQKYTLEKRHRFFTNITQVISGKKRWQLDAGELDSLWNSICFYNYVPVFVADGPRIRPTPDMFRLGAEPFMRVLRKLEPDAILVCGFQLWWWVLNDLPDGFSGTPREIRSYRIGPALAVPIKHPSTAFSSTQWRPVVASLIERVKRGAAQKR
jgi:hypothetical protein